MTKFYIQIHTTPAIVFCAMCRDEDHAADIAQAVSAANDHEQWDVERARDFSVMRLPPIA